MLPDALEAAQQQGRIMKYELPGQQITVYLDHLDPGQTLQLGYQLQAKYPVKAKAPPSAVYLYYDAETRGETGGTAFVVE